MSIGSFASPFLAVVLALHFPGKNVEAAPPGPLNFSRDVRPILSAKCFACHGPDGEDRDAEYRLDTKEGAFAALDEGVFAIVPGEPDESELVYRIRTDDVGDLMPPPKHKNPLTQEEVAVLTRWIAEGAPYADHWAFEPVNRESASALEAQHGNAVDYFIGTRLRAEGLDFSAEAPPETLVRRLHFDLTGLPPTPAEVDAFLVDPKGQFETTVDRLMETGAFAERLTQEWLDVARFADTNGYSIDDHRDMWGWRDWVIDAFAKNTPYDQFVREQLAGDLMENATDRQRVATGFLRNSMNTHEGGTIAEEYRVARIADQIDTVATAFLGLTVKCAQCHDHKYDPITARDYYRFFAFFNTSSESGNGATNSNTKPFIPVTPILQSPEDFRVVVSNRIAALDFLKAYPESVLGDTRVAWEEGVLEKAKPVTAEAIALVERTRPFPVPKKKEVPNLRWIGGEPVGDGEFAWFRKTFAVAEVPDVAQLFISCDNEAVIWVNGKRLGKNPDWREPSVFNLKPLLVAGTNIVAVAAKDWESGGVSPAVLALMAFSDGSWVASDKSWQVSTRELPGWKEKPAVEGFVAAAELKKHGEGPWGDVFAKVKSPDHRQTLLLAALQKPDVARSRVDRERVTAAFAKANTDMNDLVKSLDGEIGLLRKSLKSGKTSVMVMDEAAADRKTPMLIRGAYDQHGEIVSPGIPAVFGSLPAGGQTNRLALATWLTDPSHPLTSRVTVNRYWQMIFGTGIVQTSEDFGSQGAWPSHPELLDWLAANFVASGWDVRALLKTMMFSRTYRQSSVVTPALLEKDPTNRLLARAPRYRLSAEAVRDNALAVGGLLKEAVGGPSVYPPQPGGLWKEVSHFGHPGFFSAQHFFPDRNQQIFRRSMYTFWKRTSPPPVMMTFDAPSRETCAVRRSQTNTPLQALVLMNEPQFVAAAQGLARQMMSEGEDFEARLRAGYRLTLAREASAEELVILKKAFTRQRDYFAEDPKRASGFLGGESDVGLAAMSTIASLLLNLDETITRE